MLLGIFAQVLCNGFMSRAHSMTQLMLARMAVGMALSTGPVEMAYIMDFLHSEEDLSRVLALQRVMTSAGALAGPLVARSFDKLSFHSLCRGVMAINLFNLIVGFFLWEDAKNDKAKTLADLDEGETADADKGLADPLRTMFANQAACGLLLVSFVYALGFAIGDGPEMVFFKERFSFGKDQACIFYLPLDKVEFVPCQLAGCFNRPN